MMSPSRTQARHQTVNKKNTIKNQLTGICNDLLLSDNMLLVARNVQSLVLMNVHAASLPQTSAFGEESTLNLNFCKRGRPDTRSIM
jgi:hypothetical protein